MTMVEGVREARLYPVLFGEAKEYPCDRGRHVIGRRRQVAG